jgi:hypothetical protein
MSGGKIYKYILRNYKTDLTHAMHDMALVGYLQRLWVFFGLLDLGRPDFPVLGFIASAAPSAVYAKYTLDKSGSFICLNK